ncbi:MAG: START-like domain-containing protein [Flavobacteriaceae bacterium]
MSKTKFELEFVIQASPQLLYQYIYTPSGLSEWFADNVNARTDKYSFIWDDSEEEALLLRKKSNEFVRFRWLNGDDDQDDCYFEMRIVLDEITKDVSVVVTDFAEEDEVDETKMLWESQIGDLKQVLGST